MTGLAYVNGAISSLAEARVPALDRGFLFGDGIYETLVSYGGRLWALERHLVRLDHSLEAIGIGGLSSADVREPLERLNEQSGFERAVAYVQVTRGAPPTRGHAYGVAPEPTVVMMVTPFNDYPPEYFTKGTPLVTYADLRWRRCDIKSINLLANCMARQAAKEAGCLEALLVRDGVVTEGAASSSFMVQDGALIGPPLDRDILPGVTREIVLECAAELRIEVCLESRTLKDYLKADEVLLCGTTVEVMPVSRIDDRDIPGPGPVTQALAVAFKQRVAAGAD